MPADVLLTNTGELEFSNGDFSQGDSTFQNQQILLINGKGGIKQFPLAGVGVMDYLLDEDSALLMREIRQQFAADGMSVKKLQYSDGNFNIEATYDY